MEPSSSTDDGISSSASKEVGGMQNAALKLSTHKRPLKEVFVWLANDTLLSRSGEETIVVVKDIFDSQLEAFDKLATHLEPNTNPFVYSLDCYHRALLEKRKVGKSQNRKQVLDIVAQVAVQTGVRILQHHKDFNVKPTSQLIHALHRPYNNLLQDGYLQAMVDHLQTQNGEGVHTLFAPVLMALYNEHVETDSTANLSAKEQFKQAAHIVQPLQELASHRALRSILINLACWLPNNSTTGQDIQKSSFLGRMFRFSLCPRVGGQHEGDLHFKDVTHPTVDETTATQLVEIRDTCHLYHTMIYKLTRSIAGDRQGKSNVLDWFAAVILANKKKTQMQPTAAEMLNLSDNGFLINVCSVLLKLNKTEGSKPPPFDEIESGYMDRADARVTTANETLIAPGLCSVETKPETTGTPAAFATECFFLTLRVLHVALIPIITQYQHQYFSQYCHFQLYLNEIRRLENLATLTDVEDGMLKQMKEIVAKQSKTLLSSQVHLHDVNFAKPLLAFYAYVCSWLLHLVEIDDGNVAASVPTAFARLPEHIVEDLADCLLFISQLVPEHIDNASSKVWDPIARFMAVFVGNKLYIRNPYLLAKFVEVLHYYTPEKREEEKVAKERSTAKPASVEPPPKSAFFKAILTNKTSVEQLGSALLHFFTNVQETDSYSRASKRYHVAIILKNLWLSEPHREMLKSKSQTDPEFSRFAMLLINDTVDYLDEGRECLKKVEAYKKEIATEEFQQQTEEQRETTTHSLRSERAHAKSAFHFAKEAINLFQILTSEIVRPFLEPELVQRVAVLLNFNLSDLIHVAIDADSAGMLQLYKDATLNPSSVILALVRVYSNVAGNNHHVATTTDDESVQRDSGVKRRISGTNISGNGSGLLNDEFINAIVNDGRSFKPQLFRKVEGLLLNQPPPPSETDSKEINVAQASKQFVELLQKFEEVAAKNEEDDEDLGEIPDEYLDPILATLMVDPVKLPASGVVVDRGMIRAHLLSDPIDPFNRAPLTINDVIPQPELKTEIETWVTKTKQEAQEIKHQAKKEKLEAANTTQGGSQK